MATSKVAIFNRALSMCGQDVFIDAPGEKTKEGELFDLHYEECVRGCLEELGADWYFARKRAALVLTGDPEPECEWEYNYLKPEDMLTPQYIEDGKFTRLAANQGKFALENVNGAELIRCNWPDAVLVYTFLQMNEAFYPRPFTKYLEATIAYEIAPALKGVSKQRHQQMELRMEKLGDHAWASLCSKETEPEPPDSEFVTSRFGGGDGGRRGLSAHDYWQ